MARKDPIAHLSRHPEGPPQRLVDEILALGDAGIERLLALAADPGIDEVTRANAMIVLGQGRVERAIPRLAPMLADSELDSVLYARTSWVLARVAGPELVEPLLALPLDGERRDDATQLLACCGVADPRVAERIAELVGRDPEKGALAAQLSGDPALVPALQARFDEALATRPLAPERIYEASALMQALLQLGAEDPDREQALHVATVRANEQLQLEIEREEREIAKLQELERRLQALKG